MGTLLSSIVSQLCTKCPWWGIGSASSPGLLFAWILGQFLYLRESGWDGNTPGNSLKRHRRHSTNSEFLFSLATVWQLHTMQTLMGMRWICICHSLWRHGQRSKSWPWYLEWLSPLRAIDLSWVLCKTHSQQYENSLREMSSWSGYVIRMETGLWAKGS